MVNPKAALPQLIVTVAKKTAQCAAYTTEYQDKPWTPFVESGAKELLEDLNEKQRNLEARWQNEFKPALTEDDWEKLSAEVDKTHDKIDRARNDLRKWIHAKQGENIPNPNAGGEQAVQAQGGAGARIRESTARLVDSFKPQSLTHDHTLVEFNAWSSLFRGYYQANEKLLLANGPEFQRNFLFSVIDVKYQILLRTDDEISLETPIMGPNNLLAKLKASFMADYPLYV